MFRRLNAITVMVRFAIIFHSFLLVPKNKAILPKGGHVHNSCMRKALLHTSRAWVTNVDKANHLTRSETI